MGSNLRLEPTPSNLLAVASYGITGRIEQLIAVHRLLDELHGPREIVEDDVTASDMRCKTCRTSSGKPCPWPCATWLRFAEILGLDLGPAVVALYRAVGHERNGGKVRDAKALVEAVLAERAAGEVEGDGRLAIEEGGSDRGV